MLSKSSNTWSFHEVLADLRTTHIESRLLSPANILHGRNLVTKVQADKDIKAITSLLQERQLKMMLVHYQSKKARKVRPLVVGEKCYVSGLKSEWIDAFVVGITDSGRSYDTRVEVTGGSLRRNRSHIRQKSPDILIMHDSFLHGNLVSLAAPNMNTPSTSKNSFLKGVHTEKKLASHDVTVMYFTVNW